MTEAAKLNDVLQFVGDIPLWYGQVDQTNTTIWAQFKGMNPNEQLVEINVRQTVFYPDKPAGIVGSLGAAFSTIAGTTEGAIFF